MGHSGIWILSWGSRTITNKVARVLSLFVTTRDESDRSIIIAGLVLVDASCTVCTMEQQGLLVIYYYSIRS